MAFFDDGITYRYTLEAEATAKLNKKIGVNGRLLFQNRVQDEYDPSIATSTSLFWRVRGLLKLEATNKVDLYASVEPVMEIGGYHFVDNWRDIVGIKFKMNKKTKLDLWYMYRPDYGKSTYNRLFHVLGLNLTYRFKT